MAQVETSPPDSLVTMEENVLIFKDTRLDLLNKRPALMAKVEEEKEKDKIVNYNPIVSADGKKKVTGSIYTSKGFRIIIYKYLINFEQNLMNIVFRAELAISL